MKTGVPWSLAVLALAVGGVAIARSGNVATPPAKTRPQLETVELHRCTDARGKVTWQDDPCPAGSRDEKREMARPVDAPVPPAAPAAPAVPALPAPEPPRPPARQFVPPPPMYLCTTYDGDSRFSENYDPNPRCEPLVLYYPYPNQLTPQQALSCRWVEDSCVRLSDAQACAQWRVRQKEAFSLAQRAFSDTQEYRRSELARINQIVSESCP